MKHVKICTALTIALLASACSTMDSTLPSGDAAYAIIPPREADSAARTDYKIGPQDVLSVTVFQEPDLSFKEIQVDAAGNLLFPLVGQIQAGGKSAGELSKEISSRLDGYIVNPQVSVVIASSVSQQVTVEGNVTQPGVYDISGSTSLLQALAQAKSPTRVARLDQVIVFRTVNGKRFGAVFDVRKIRVGAAPDPQLAGGDIVVVGFSAVKGAFRDFLTTAPFFSVFRPF